MLETSILLDGRAVASNAAARDLLDGALPLVCRGEIVAASNVSLAITAKRRVSNACLPDCPLAGAR